MPIKRNGIDQLTSKSKRIIIANQQFRKSYGEMPPQAIQPQYAHVGVRDS